jgi:hypothetical protein
VLNDVGLLDVRDATHFVAATATSDNIEVEGARFILHLAQQLRRRGAPDALAW